MSDMETWQEYNRNYLRLELDHLGNVLKPHCGIATDEKVPNPQPGEYIPALERICHDFALTQFERQLILLCAGVQLDREFGEWCATIRGDPSKPWVSLDLAVQVFNHGDWLAFTTQSTLRYWQLIEVDDSKAASLSPLHLDETILHYITGHPVSDPNFEPYLLPRIAERTLVATHHSVARQIGHIFQQPRQSESMPILILDGAEQEAKAVIASHTCEELGMQLHRIDSQVLPRDTQGLHNLYKRIEREAILHRCAFLFEGDIAQATSDAMRSLSYLLQRLSAPCMVAVSGTLSNLNREVIKLEVKRPGYQEQTQVWQSALADNTTPDVIQQLPRLLDQFDLSAQQIHSITRQWISAQDQQANNSAARLWALCRQQARHKVANLARIIEPKSDKELWGTLILPQEAMHILHTIVDQVRQRHRVYQEWGFADQSAYGLGISALFAGVSGTGKTLAARVIASQLELDIYHIDLSSIVSKYIGETEKNLERIFTAAENSGAILLFDEADALFAKRSQVNDSKDRYANMEVSYLLQRMEAYAGLSILTTNYKSNLDDAFVRRLRFIVQFPFPQDVERGAIWRKIFPPDTPVNGLDYEKLARLEIPGGIIRGIAINAAFHAAGNGGKVEMQHILQAAQEEYAKSEKTLLNELVVDW